MLKVNLLNFTSGLASETKQSGLSLMLGNAATNHKDESFVYKNGVRVYGRNQMWIEVDRDIIFMWFHLEKLLDRCKV